MIRYSYLWHREHLVGREEGTKDRPSAIILALCEGADPHVVVVPLTHTPPGANESAMDLPLAVKRHLGLDGERTWIIFSESNVFRWPGPDLRRIPGKGDETVAYGFLPPKLFAELRRRFIERDASARAARVPRSE